MSFKKIGLVAIVLIMALVVVACGGNTTEPPAQEPDLQPQQEELNSEDVVVVDNYDSFIVNVDWMKNNIDNDAVLVIDARGADAHAEGHIPGAVPVKWQQFAKMTGAPGEPEWGTVLDAAELSEQLQAIGVENDKQIIVYADPIGWGEDGRIVWMLHMAGVENSRILDGGWPAWVAANGEVSKENVEVVPSNFQVAQLDYDTFADTEWVSSNLGDAVVIIDTRNEKEFNGATDFGEARGGHIPGAISLPYNEFFNLDGTIKSAKEITAMMAEKNIEKDAQIVTYCTAGIRSAHMTIVLQMAGYDNVKNYDASIYEWAANDTLPMN